MDARRAEGLRRRADALEARAMDLEAEASEDEKALLNLEAANAVKDYLSMSKTEQEALLAEADTYDIRDVETWDLKLESEKALLNMDYDRNIDQLLEFIQGDDRKEQVKKKKKKKSKQVASVKVKATPLTTVRQTLEVEARTDVLKANALDAVTGAGGANAFEPEVDMETALKVKPKEKDVKDMRHDSLKSDTVDGCKKKVKSTMRTEDEEVDRRIAEREAMLEERRCDAESIIESKSKEMRKLITDFEVAEDSRSATLKEVSDIDARVEEMQKLRARLLLKCEAKEEVMSKLTKKRKKLEEFIDSQISKFKSETSQLEADLKDLKLNQSKSDNKIMSGEVKTVESPNLQLLHYIDNKIETKEKELECPVCLEVASVPIFMCDESHLICSSCRPKV